MDVDAILHGLNNAQRDSVTSQASVLQVLAPPGSGKTKTLTARVAYLIAHWQLKPWNIIVCTFTRKAANEMKERIRKFVGDELAKQIKLGTFHAIAVLYLRQYGHHIGLEKDFGIADSADSKAILTRIIKRNSFTIQSGQALGRISAQKVKGINSEELARAAKHIEQQEFALVFAEYEAELQRSNLLDYDDLLLRCCSLMQSHPQCVSNVDAVLIDEFQDTNTVQYELMGLFAQRRNVITIVGDPDQSIYGFRSAEIKNLSRMKGQWPDTLTINLEENYRSSGAILHAAQKIIEQDETRPPKKLQATHSPGQRPILRKLPSAAAEASWLVSEIKRIHALSGDVLLHSDFAILLRSAALSRVIESALGKEGLPYRMVGGTKFYDRAEVKLILDYLRVIHQPSNSEALERVLNVPSRRVGETTIKTLRVEASSKKVTLWSLVNAAAQGHALQTKISAAAQKGISTFVSIVLNGRRKLSNSDSQQSSLLDLMNFTINKIEMQSYLKQKYESEHEARWANVEELLAQAADMSDPERLKAMSEEQSLPVVEGLEQQVDDDTDALSIFLANIALTASVEDRTVDGGPPVPQVTISTIHSAKGLEWPIVFIPACFEGSIPHSRAEDNDEERRLLYVGMTRAQAMLYLSCPIKNTQREETTMSCFLTQPGVSNFFEEHGPTMSLPSACGLAVTLRRELPDEEQFNAGKKALENDEDNYWPVNSEEPREELAKWDYGRAGSGFMGFSSARTPAGITRDQMTSGNTHTLGIQPGFKSVKDQYDDLMEKGRLKSIDKRAESRHAQENPSAPKGRKRQIEGQGTLTGFLSKRPNTLPETTMSSLHSRTIPTAIQPARPLRDISNLNAINENPLPAFRSTTSFHTSHKLRTVPMKHPAPKQQNKLLEQSYVFLSSSPPPFEDEPRSTEFAKKDKVVDRNEDDDVTATPVTAVPSMQVASTFHVTSMQSAQTSRRKTYGVRPSFNGWANRARK